MANFHILIVWVRYRIIVAMTVYLLLFIQTSFSQSLSPDSAYFSYTKVASHIYSFRKLNQITDIDLRRKLVDSALTIYEDLDKKYFMPCGDVVQFFKLSYLTEDSVRFITSSKRLKNLTGYTVSQLIPFYCQDINVSKEFSYFVQNSASLKAAPTTPLNWHAILNIYPMMETDVEYRTLMP